MPDKPVLHGRDHRPGGQDPSSPGAWVYVADSSLPSWNSGTNYSPDDSVGDGIYNYVCILANGPGVLDRDSNPTTHNPGVTPYWTTYWVISQPVFLNLWFNTGGSFEDMRFRISVGHYNQLDLSTGSIAIYHDHQLEIQGSASGGNSGTVVFTLPPAYMPAHDLRLPASDDQGAFVVLQVLSTGEVIRGVV